MSISRNAKHEFSLLRSHISIVHVLVFVSFLYVCSFPMRRLSHYNHKTLAEYWPESFEASSSRAIITFYNSTSNRHERLDLLSYVHTFAPNHGLDLKRVSIQKENFIEYCDGCMDALRLRDIGHQHTFDWTLTKNPMVSEMCMAAAFVYCILFSLAPVFFDASTLRVHVVYMWVRTLRAAMILHTLRAAFHLSTSMPGPPMHCQSSVVRGGGGNGVDQPHLYPNADSLGAFLAMLFSFGGGKSCGDLMYSGHMITSCLTLLSTVYYAPKIFSPRLSALFILFALILCCTQGFLIISFRNHYTVDVVATMLITTAYLVWDIHAFPDSILPNRSSELVGLAPAVLRKSACSTRASEASWRASRVSDAGVDNSGRRGPPELELYDARLELYDGEFR